VCLKTGFPKVEIGEDGQPRQVPRMVYYRLRASGIRDLRLTGTDPKIIRMFSGHSNKEPYDTNYNPTDEPDMVSAADRTWTDLGLTYPAGLETGHEEKPGHEQADQAANAARRHS
jgi:hypothetical protein